MNYAVGYYRFGEVAEWLNAAVLKTVVPQGTVGSNPTSSAKLIAPFSERRFLILNAMTPRGREGSNYGSFKKALSMLQHLAH